jgi:hypothetical protein
MHLQSWAANATPLWHFIEQLEGVIPNACASTTDSTPEKKRTPRSSRSKARTKSPLRSSPYSVPPEPKWRGTNSTRNERNLSRAVGDTSRQRLNVVEGLERRRIWSLAGMVERRRRRRRRRRGGLSWTAASVLWRNDPPLRGFERPDPAPRSRFTVHVCKLQEQPSVY